MTETLSRERADGPSSAGCWADSKTYMKEGKELKRVATAAMKLKS